MAFDLDKLRFAEHAEITHEFAADKGLSYTMACARLGLAPSPDGWGFLYCKAGPDATRITLATTNLSLHRTFVEVFNSTRTEAGTRIPPSWASSYGHGRFGWPDDWDPESPGDPLPWHQHAQTGIRRVGQATAVLADYRITGTTQLDLAHEAHRDTRVVEVFFFEGGSGARWCVLGIDRFELPIGYGDLLIIDPTNERVEWIAARGVAVYPGWPTREVPRQAAPGDCTHDAALWRSGNPALRWYSPAAPLEERPQRLETR